MSSTLTQAQIIQISATYGTPLYIYDSDKITTQYEKLKNAFKAYPTRFFYACKALSNINILKHLNQLGASLDCVSINEVKMGLKAGFLPEQIIFTPNCVDLEEIEEGKNLGVHINIDNISILEQYGNKYGDSYPVFIRINPHIEAGGNYKISTGHIDSKFGISIHQMRHVNRIVATTHLKINGLHMHTGSEIKDIKVFLQALEIMFNIASNFNDLKYLDLGSGFKVPYKDDDHETDIDELGIQLSAAMHTFQKEYPNALEIWFEPGKYLVSEAGTFVVKANVIKQTTATVFVGVNSGFNHLIRPMFYDAYHKITNISNPTGVERIYTIVGNICETDTFAWDRVLNEVREGDLLAFHNAGAYGFEMSSNFNSRLKPAEVMIKNKIPYLIRERDHFEDLFRKQIEIMD